MVTSDPQEEFLAIAAELAYYGKDDPKPVASEGMPYQHDGMNIFMSDDILIVF